MRYEFNLLHCFQLSKRPGQSKSRISTKSSKNAWKNILLMFVTEFFLKTMQIDDDESNNNT